MSSSSDLWFLRLTDTALQIRARVLLRGIEFRPGVDLPNSVAALHDLETQTPFPDVAIMARTAREHLSDTARLQHDLAKLFSISVDTVSWKHYEVACGLTIRDVLRAATNASFPDKKSQEVVLAGYRCLIPQGDFEITRLCGRHWIIHEDTTIIIDSQTQSLQVDLVDYGKLPLGATLAVIEGKVFVNGRARDPIDT